MSTWDWSYSPYTRLQRNKAHFGNHFYATLDNRQASSPCKEQYSLAAEREGVVQSNPLNHDQLYLLSTVSSNMFIFVYIVCKYKALLIPMPKYWNTVGLLPVKTLALWTEHC